jgi:hypothetical protein
MKRLLAVLVVASFTVALPAAAQAKVLKSKSFVQLGDLGLADNDASGDPSQGDMQTFSFIQSNHAGGRKVGTGHGYCVLNEDPFAICTAVLRDLKGNTLVIMWQDKSTEQSFTFAIVGGTGKYRLARGHGKSVAQNGDATKFVVKARIVY